MLYQQWLVSYLKWVVTQASPEAATVPLVWAAGRGVAVHMPGGSAFHVEGVSARKAEPHSSSCCSTLPRPPSPIPLAPAVAQCHRLSPMTQQILDLAPILTCCSANVYHRSPIPMAMSPPPKPCSEAAFSPKPSHCHQLEVVSPSPMAY